MNIPGSTSFWTCCACGSSNAKKSCQVPYSQGRDKSLGDLALSTEHLKYRVCSDCGVISADDWRRDPAKLLEAYRLAGEDYFHDLSGGKAFVDFYRRLEKLLLRWTEGGRLLDVGCGTGEFLSTLSSRWYRVGVEPSMYATAVARAKGIDCYNGTLTDCSFAPESFNVITMVDVFEHLLDPGLYLTEAFKLLQAKGYLLIVTGDAQSLTARLMGSRWQYLFGWGHVCIRNHSALRRMARSIGFTELALLSVNHPFGMSPGRWLYWSLRASVASALRSLGVLQKLEKSQGLVFSYCYDHMLALFQKP